MSEPNKVKIKCDGGCGAFAVITSTQRIGPNPTFRCFKCQERKKKIITRLQASKLY